MKKKMGELMLKQFKMYKSGKQWIIASVSVTIAVTSLGLIESSVFISHSNEIYAASPSSVNIDGIKSAPSSILLDTQNFPNVTFVNNNNAIGIAAFFSIFAQNAKLGADVNGNIAVQNLVDSNRDFGTRSNNFNLTSNDVSYIQNINSNKQLNDSAFRADNSVAILGESIKIAENSAGQMEVNDGRVSTLSTDNTYQDVNGNKYINFDDYFATLLNKAVSYKETAQSNGVVSDYSDMNNQSIDVSGVDKTQKYVYVDIDYSKLGNPQDVTIKGLSSQLDGPTVIFNVKNIPDSN